jgi:glycerophosphodiester phosphodiesterase
MFWECSYWEMEPYWTEMNEYIDITLDVVFELGGNRSIFFTCFNPEVCILLSTKQKTYPVVFLNDSMVSGPAGDKRATSLQQAVRFARMWDLQGIVMAAEPFVAAPKLIKYVKDQQGLFCGSYGSLNDVPEFAKVRYPTSLFSPDS